MFYVCPPPDQSLYDQFAAALPQLSKAYNYAANKLHIPVLLLEDIRSAFREKFDEWAANGSLGFVRQEIKQGKRFRLFLSPNAVLVDKDVEDLFHELTGKEPYWERDYSRWTPEEHYAPRPGGSSVNFTLVSDEPTLTQGDYEEHIQEYKRLKKKYPSIVIPGIGDTAFRMLEIMDGKNIAEIDNPEDLFIVARLDMKPIKRYPDDEWLEIPVPFLYFGQMRLTCFCLDNENAKSRIALG